MAKGTALAVKSAVATAIRQQLAGNDLDISKFAKKLKTSRTAVRRILDKKNTAISLRTLVKAADAAGLEFSIGIRKKSPAEIGVLAHKLAGANSRAEATRLRKQLVTGFYGSD
jgi:predicted XRE-type DNA-binding protein